MSKSEKSKINSFDPIVLLQLEFSKKKDKKKCCKNYKKKKGKICKDCPKNHA